MTTTNAKELWKIHANKDGFISKSIDEILEEEQIESYDEVKEYSESLNTAVNFFDTEFKDEKEEEWRFID